MEDFPASVFRHADRWVASDSDRGQLYKVMVQYMHLHHPLMVVGENVINLLANE
jgi:hypothetical protein